MLPVALYFQLGVLVYVHLNIYHQVLHLPSSIAFTIKYCISTALSFVRVQTYKRIICSRLKIDHVLARGGSMRVTSLQTSNGRRGSGMTEGMSASALSNTAVSRVLDTVTLSMAHTASRVTVLPCLKLKTASAYRSVVLALEKP